MADGYVDIYLLPIPEGSIVEYTRQATLFGAVTVEHGALSYRESAPTTPATGSRSRTARC